MKGRLTALLLLLAMVACGDQDSAVEVSQRDKAFHPNAVELTAGETVVLHNDDKRTHNIRVFHPKMDFNSGSQEPDEDVHLSFDEPGTYYVTCGIHPQMELKVEVTKPSNTSNDN